MYGYGRNPYQQADPFAGVPYWAVGSGMPLLGDLTPNLNAGSGMPTQPAPITGAPYWTLGSAMPLLGDLTPNLTAGSGHNLAGADNSPLWQHGNSIAGTGPYASVQGGSYYPQQPSGPMSWMDVARALFGGW